MLKETSFKCLHINAPETEHDQRPELGVPVHPDDDFLCPHGPAAARDNPRYPRPAYIGLREDDEIEGIADVRRSLHVEPYPADIGLMKNIRRSDLHDYGIADLVGKADGLLDGVAKFRGRDGNPVGLEHVPRFRVADLEPPFRS